jgi:biotin-dependent carboxylase-like uncharacterized protein
VSGLRVVEAGLFATVQDLGRPGYQRHGVPVSGALDPMAHRLANALVGNAPGAAALELRFLGPVLEVEAERVRLALAGAAIAARIERGAERIELREERSITLRRGDRLRVGPLRESSTATLAVAGGVDVAPVLGSRSTFTRGGFGGLSGRALAAGDFVPLGRAGAPVGPEQELGEPLDIRPPERVRVVLGPQADHFTEAAVETFLAAEWRISKDADRMGLRLEGPELAHRESYNIVSDGIVTGAIQVPGTRLPILLLADRQTSGGYPKIATVITADLPALGRLAPGAALRFAAVSAAEGAEAARARAAEFARLVARIRTWRPPGAVDEAALHRENLIQPPVALEGPE